MSYIHVSKVSRATLYALSIFAAAMAPMRSFAQAIPASSPPAQASPTPVPLGSVNIPSDKKWHYSVTPYFFLPQINGKFQTRFPGIGTINAHAPLSSYLPHLNALTHITGEARKKSFVAAFDYISFSAPLRGIVPRKPRSTRR